MNSLFSHTVLRTLSGVDNFIQMIRRRLVPAELVVFEDLTGLWLGSALSAAAELNLASVVPDVGEIDVSLLAESLDLQPMPLTRLLQVLVSSGYFRLSANETQVSHTRLSMSLKPGVGGRFTLLQTSSWYRRCFSPESVSEGMRLGCSPFEVSDSQDFFGLLSQDEEKQALFSDAMSEVSAFCTPYLVPFLRFGADQKVLDVGGGSGQLCALLSRHNKQTEFSVLDRQSESLATSVAFLQGDFFVDIPKGFDHILLKNILHDWNDECCLQVLQNCADSMEPSGHLHIIELVLPEAGQQSTLQAKDFLVDWNVYCTLGAQERRLSEFKALLERTGWTLSSATKTASPLWVLSCVRASDK